MLPPSAALLGLIALFVTGAAASHAPTVAPTPATTAGTPSRRTKYSDGELAVTVMAVLLGGVFLAIVGARACKKRKHERRARRGDALWNSDDNLSGNYDSFNYSSRPRVQVTVPAQQNFDDDHSSHNAYAPPKQPAFQRSASNPSPQHPRSPLSADVVPPPKREFTSLPKMVKPTIVINTHSSPGQLESATFAATGALPIVVTPAAAAGHHGGGGGRWKSPFRDPSSSSIIVDEASLESLRVGEISPSPCSAAVSPGAMC